MKDDAAVRRELARLMGDTQVLTNGIGTYMTDASPVVSAVEPDAVVFPKSAEEVEALMRWAYRRDVPLVPRGGGSGLAGGAVPIQGGVVVSLERLRTIRELDPAAWRIAAEAGLTTAHVQRLARENGLYLPLNPGAAEQSQLGGNLATNAAGPRAFKYGPIRAFVTGLEAVVPPGETIRVGGGASKDVSGYDLAGLLIGSEGTLGVITSAWLRLLPAPSARRILAGFCSSFEDLADAVANVMVSGIRPAALEYLDTGALQAAAPGFPAHHGAVPTSAAGMIMVEVEGERQAVDRETELVSEALAEGAMTEIVSAEGRAASDLLAWRDSVSSAVRAKQGSKLSEDICVPVERLGEAITATVEIGHRHQLPACSWGHAGDGNLHATFLLSPGSPTEDRRAHAAAAELFDLALSLGGTISGEHGLGALKNGYLRKQWGDKAVALHRQLKSTIDPKGLMNPGKKLP